MSENEEFNGTNGHGVEHEHDHALLEEGVGVITANNNNNNNSHNNDENTPLLSGGVGNASMVENGQPSHQYEQQQQPQQQYWPTTYDQSISLLAGPQRNLDAIDRMTRSPRIAMPYQAMNARKQLQKLGRGYHTPDPRPSSGAGSGGSGAGPYYNNKKATGGRREPSSPGSPGPAHFHRTMQKTQSLDFYVPPTAASSSKEQKFMQIMEQQSQRMAQAAAYRQKILSGARQPLSNQHKKSSSDDLAMLPKRQHQHQRHDNNNNDDDDEHDEIEIPASPGYQREKDSLLLKPTQEDFSTTTPLKEEKSTFSQSVFNMANILMGVGMLGLPLIFKSAGWIGGLGVTLGFGFMMWRTSILIGRLLNGDPRPCGSDFSKHGCYRSKLCSFPEIAHVAFGHVGAFGLAVMLYFELFSCLAIFLVSLGDHLHSLVPAVARDHHMMGAAIVLALPTTVLRTPRLLSYLSTVGTVATVCVVAAVCLSALCEGNVAPRLAAESLHATDADVSIIKTIPPPPYHVWFRSSGLPLAVGLIAYTFSGHAIVPNIYASMDRPQQNFEPMMHLTFVIVVVSCLVVAVSGYTMFGSFVDDQITLSLETKSTNPVWTMDLLVALMILTAFSKFALTMFPLAIGMEEFLVTTGWIPPTIDEETMESTISPLIKLVLIAASLYVALYVPSFSFLCGLVGLICTMTVSVIFPAAAHLTLFGPQLTNIQKAADLLFILIGLVSAIVGTVATLS